MKYCWFLVFLTFACANPIPPTGGPKDLDPPVLLHTQPENKTLNFDGSSISMDFSEYIKEENLLTQLMITPNLKSPYKYRVNKNRITLTFEEPFDSATTYTLNFREGIKDITEGNVPPNLKFVFSTGNYLDSAAISGTVRSLMSKELLEDITISLYVDPDTIDLFTGPPRYSTKSDKEGNFVIENIKNGQYLVYAIDDKNRNLKLESRTEGYGYLPNSLILDDSIPGIHFLIYNLDTRPIVLQNSRPVGNNFDMKFNKALFSYEITAEDLTINSNLVEDNQTIRVYNTTLPQDSVALALQVTDSLNQTLDSLIYLKFEESTRKPEEFTYQLSLKDGPVNKLWETRIKFNKPIQSINYDSIYFRFDSLYQIPISDSMVVFGQHRDELELKLNFRNVLPSDTLFSNWGNKFELRMAQGSIISVENDSIPQVSKEYSFKKPKDFGIIRGSVNSDYQSYVIQLVDNSFDIVAEVKSSELKENTYQFIHMESGNYSIRILIDENNNGIWEPGNILESIPAEPIKLFFHPNVDEKKINLRANWEQSGIDLVF